MHISTSVAVGMGITWYNKRIKGVEGAQTISMDHLLIILTAIGVSASLF